MCVVCKCVYVCVCVCVCVLYELCAPSSPVSRAVSFHLISWTQTQTHTHNRTHTVSHTTVFVSLHTLTPYPLLNNIYIYIYIYELGSVPLRVGVKVPTSNPMAHRIVLWCSGKIYISGVNGIQQYALNDLHVPVFFGCPMG